ncbi:hypothetical protein HPB51_028015 [Rhipicephalus microplus]|uniref:Uncharacterized protein n=1 Tax=Rhipicephalus microplus TaxID=6941 RepID=A0A9J6CYZ3_RHIMP|nr:hypothetical protein HPB51_028015 [Rhipicephalus microplus]
MVTDCSAGRQPSGRLQLQLVQLPEPVDAAGRHTVRGTRLRGAPTDVLPGWRDGQRGLRARRRRGARPDAVRCALQDSALRQGLHDHHLLRSVLWCIARAGAGIAVLGAPHRVPPLELGRRPGQRGHPLLDGLRRLPWHGVSHHGLCVALLHGRQIGRSRRRAALLRAREHSSHCACVVFYAELRQFHLVLAMPRTLLQLSGPGAVSVLKATCAL